MEGKTPGKSKAATAVLCLLVPFFTSCQGGGPAPLSSAPPPQEPPPSAPVGHVPFQSGATFQDPDGTEMVLVNGSFVEAAKDQVLIYLTEDVTQAELENVVNKIQAEGGVLIGSLPETRTLQVSISSSASEEVFMASFDGMPGVVAAGLNEVVNFTQDNQQGYKQYLEKVWRLGARALEKVLEPAVALPSGFDGGEFYWIEHTQAAQAWDKTTGSAVDQATIGIVDTGIEKGQRVLSESRLSRYDETGKVLEDDDTKEAEKGEHGRWVTGFAAGFLDGEDHAVRGMAWENRVIMIDVGELENDCFIDFLGVRLACQEKTILTDAHLGVIAAMGRGAQIINFSIGPKTIACEDDPDTPDNEADHEHRVAQLTKWREFMTPIVDAVKRNDRLLILAAGNACEKQDNDLLPEGSAVDGDSWKTHALYVAATNSNRRDADFSNMGKQVDIAAPGDEIAFRKGAGWLGTLEQLLGLNKGSGTSYAAPLVTGTAALMRSVNPTLAPPETRHILLGAADRLEITAEPKRLLNAARAVNDAASMNNVPLIVLPEVQLSKDEIGQANVVVNLPDSTVPSLDVLFLVDVSGSYGDDIDTLQLQAGQIITNLSSRGIDVRFGVASFADFPLFPFGDGSVFCGDQAFYLHQEITGNIAAVEAGLNLLDNPLHCGGDLPESQLEALYQAATGAGRDLNGDGDFDDPGELKPTNIGWRTGSLRTIILATDARFHDPATEVYPCLSCASATFTGAIDALKTAGISVIGLDSGDAFPDLQVVVNDTGGTLFALSDGSVEISDRIAQGITEQLEAVLLSVERVSGSDWVKEITPESYADVPAGSTRIFTVTLEGLKNNGSQAQHYDVYLWVRADNSAIVGRIRISIVVPVD